MVARATAPNRIGPESVFPDAAKWDFEEGLKGLSSLSWSPVAYAYMLYRLSHGICAFLDCVDMSDRDCGRLLLVLPQGAALYVYHQMR
jgi:hypothetical protein